MECAVPFGDSVWRDLDKLRCICRPSTMIVGLRWDSKVYEKSLEKLAIFNLEKTTFKDNKILVFKGLK